MVQSKDTFDDLHAPEVVRPLVAPKDVRHRESPVETNPAVKRQQKPPVETKLHPEKPSGALTAKPQQPKAPAPPSAPAAAPPPLQSAEPKSAPMPPPRSQQVSPSSRNRGRIAIPLVAGVILLIWIPLVVGVVLLIWYAASTPSDAPSSSSPPADIVRQRSPASIHSPSPLSPASHPPSAIEYSAVSAAPRHTLSTDAAPRASTCGSIRISAFAVDSNGHRLPITKNATVKLKHEGSYFGISTNIGIPCLCRNVQSGKYRLSLDIPGYCPSTSSRLTVFAATTNVIAVAMRPLPARVRFTFPSTNVVYEVYNNEHRLGDSTTDWNLTPFTPHFLTFKADNWRPKRVKVQLPEPGKSYRCPIAMKRVASGLRMTVNARNGESPERGYLSINGSRFVEVELPFERHALPVTGEMILVLVVDGFTVLDSTQRVVLADREVKDVVFAVERRSWLSRMFGPSDRHIGNR